MLKQQLAKVVAEEEVLTKLVAADPVPETRVSTFIVADTTAEEEAWKKYDEARIAVCGVLYFFYSVVSPHC